MRSIKNVALLTEDGAFALVFLPHPGGFASSRVPTPGNLPSMAKKMLIPGGQPGGGAGGWAQVELTDALLPSKTLKHIRFPLFISTLRTLHLLRTRSSVFISL